MTGIGFKPWVVGRKNVVAFGIQAYKQPKNTLRKVFDRPSGQKSDTYQIGVILRSSPNCNSQATNEAKRVAKTLNKWIGSRSEVELNILAPLIKAKPITLTSLTKGQVRLLVAPRIREPPTLPSTS